MINTMPTVRRWVVVVTSIPGDGQPPTECRCVEPGCKKKHKSGGITFSSPIPEETALHVVADVHPKMTREEIEEAFSIAPYIIDCGDFSIGRVSENSRLEGRDDVPKV